MNALDDLLVKQYSDMVSEEAKPLNTESTKPSGAAEDTSLSSAHDKQMVDDEPCISRDDPDSEIELNDDVTDAETNAETADEATVSNIDESNRPELKSAWEVDRFLWPAICGDVEEHVEAELSATVESIRAECSQRNHHIVAIVSVAPGSGGTTATMCLAREAARQGQRVALVDLNNERPALADNLGIDCEQGIDSLQLADIDLEDICVTALEDGVTLVPLLQPVDIEYSVSPTIQALLSRVAATHDLVLIDAPKAVIDRLANESPEIGVGVILVTDAQATNETTDEHVRAKSETSWNLGTIKNFAA